MFKKASSSVSWVETYMQLVLPLMQQTKLGIEWRRSNFILFPKSSEIIQNYHVQISVPYVKETLRWEMSFNPFYPELGPDLFFDQVNHLEKEDSECFSDNISSLMMWDFTDGSSLLKLIDELLFFYKSYQLNLLKIYAERSHIDFQSFVKGVPLENLEIMVSIRSKQTRFQILVKFFIDQSNTKAQQFQGWNILLLNIRGTSLSYVTPELYLSPSIKNCLYGIDLEHIPLINENQELADYLFAIKNYISEKIAIYSSCFEKRKQFIISLLVLQYATVLEYDAISYRKVSLHLKNSDIYFILSFVLPLNFPEEQFCLSLHSIYHMTDQGTPFFKHIGNIPYSPRWEPKQMIAKALQRVLDAEMPFF
ncbi:BRISC and BRCA1-A complex member 2 isoform X2 [Nasonia vitripennis]|uniref:BRISC and BRCA1-A complex member 2 n=1 Tax=Nasonia vitripennis TaxID=7425 RepID=A0A7M7R234_NASVI|nr:BRISC and BRCA1-A complex member 2 isoform X2 [Nasonia vitripennis]XP_031786021.1 BRISC and BRCA1-A complex member 2 isoform X2 [Nasonia vitripennis]XP_031786022.1 BRISC and BRCA1-A complex member 2 isoform X2 [Nasonia vitripennis]XP_031786023.1 BRISC and BRCA1-A complex member 2 isoform X2 [Nasonia vitripennis]XP_031786024.1 BRISC and BRCA1-A complex member 2 isoform X2 [Nasonia vitripennis]XP_032457957.1 BRISC and BRCA1-A complex member 2 isoform X2 [Nasonia vitripennis]XP_032457958.1 BR